jgi:hypothetical protein
MAEPVSGLSRQKHKVRLLVLMPSSAVYATEANRTVAWARGENNDLHVKRYIHSRWFDRTLRDRCHNRVN